MHQLKAKMDANEKFILVDIREAHEKAYSDLGGILIPLSRFEAEYVKLEGNKNDDIILYCRSGGRSASAVAYLKARGYKNVMNLAGGINKWAAEIDPSIPIY